MMIQLWKHKPMSKTKAAKVPEDAVKKDRAFISASRQETQPLKNAVGLETVPCNLCNLPAIRLN